MFMETQLSIFNGTGHCLLTHLAPLDFHNESSDPAEDSVLSRGRAQLQVLCEVGMIQCP